MSALEDFRRFMLFLALLHLIALEQVQCQDYRFNKIGQTGWGGYDGNVFCMGNTQQDMMHVPTGLRATAFALGLYHTCALTESGEVVCWAGLGDGSASPPSDLGTCIAIAAGEYHTCAVTTAGQVRCFGKDDRGQSTVPTDLFPAKQVSAGKEHSCALAATGGAVQCWGRDNYGQAQVPTDLAPAAKVTSGGWHNCALSETGTIQCWGRPSRGLVSDVPTDGPFQDIGSGTWHACAVRSSNGEVVCWGGSTTSWEDIPAGLVARSVAVGWTNVCAIMANPNDVPSGADWNTNKIASGGGLVCWGNAGWGKRSLHVDMGLQNVQFLATSQSNTCMVADPPPRPTTVMATTTTLLPETTTAALEGTTVVEITTAAAATTTVAAATSTEGAAVATTTAAVEAATTGGPTVASTAEGAVSTTAAAGAVGTSAEAASQESTTAVQDTNAASSLEAASVATTPAVSLAAGKTSSEPAGTPGPERTSLEPAAVSGSTSLGGSSTPKPDPTTTPTSDPTTTPTSDPTTTPTSDLTTTPTSDLTTTVANSSNAGGGVQLRMAFAGVACDALKALPPTLEGFISAVEEGILASLKNKKVTRRHCYTRIFCAKGRRLQVSGTSGLDSETTVYTSEAQVSADAVQRALQAAADAGAIGAAVEQRAQAVPGFADVADLTTFAAQPSVASVLAAAPLPEALPKPLPMWLLLRLVEESKGTALAGIGASSSTTVPVAKMGEELLATKLRSLAAGGVAGAEIAVPHPGFDLKVLLPQSFLSQHAGDVPGDLAMATVAFNRSVGEGVAPEFFAGMAIDLDRLSGASYPVSGLAEPIVFSLPVIYDDKRLACAYWDKTAGGWSTEGVSVNSRTVLGGQLWCQTTHLSFFAAILQGILETVRCSNFDVFHAESWRRFQETEWYKGEGSIVLFSVLACILALYGAAAFTDRYRGSRDHWTDEFFLVEEPEASDPGEDVEKAAKAAEASKEEEAEEEEVAEEPKEPLHKRCTDTCCACLGNGHVKEALDDVISNWFEEFADIRGCIEGICEGVELETLRKHPGESVWLITRRIMDNAIILASRRRTAASLFMHSDTVGFVMHEQDLAAFLMDDRTRESVQELHQRPRTPGNWRSTSEQAHAWMHLREEVCREALGHAREHGRGELLHFLGSLFALFFGQNPLGSIFLIDIFSSAKMKVNNVVAELLGSYVLTGVFFDASGMMRGRASTGEYECDVDGKGLAHRFGRFLVIAMGSLLLAGIPVGILESLNTKGFERIDGVRGSDAWKRQLRVWRIQEACYWVLSLLYEAACLAYLLLFLANLGEEDHYEFALGCLLSLFIDFLALPIVVALLIPVVAKVLLHFHVHTQRVDRAVLVREVCERMHENSNAMLPIEPM